MSFLRCPIRSCVLALFFALSVNCADDDKPTVGANVSTANNSDNSGTTPDASINGVDPDATIAPDAGGELPMIQDADLCNIPDNPNLTVTEGTDLMKVTLDAPNAICNDGSPAIVYVRPAPNDSQNADKWLLWLEGGGSCNSGPSCVARWCGENDLYTAGKMSSRFAPQGIRGTGIFADRPENSFADWNHVVGYYCSSDNWSGRKRTSAVSETGDHPDFDLYFHGAYIVDDMIATLKEGAQADDGATTLPSIDNATMVVLSGTSAGGGGARYNADRVGELLRETNADVDYRLVVDAGTYPSEPNPPELSEADALALLDLKYDTITNWRNGVTDESCLEYHADDPRWCADNSHLIFHHITTPWYVKMDLTDGANRPGPYADNQTFARVTFDFYSSIVDGTHVPEEAGVPTDSAGLFIPNCGHHVNLEVGAFYAIEITNGTVGVSNHDILRNWLAGTEPTQVLHNPPAGFTSNCP